MLLEEDDDWANKCMVDEIEGLQPRGTLKRTLTVVVENNCQTCRFNKEDAVDRSRWGKLMKDV